MNNWERGNALIGLCYKQGTIQTSSYVFDTAIVTLTLPLNNLESM